MIDAYDKVRNKFLREVYIETNIENLITFISENCINIFSYKQDELINKDINAYILDIPKSTTHTKNFQGTLKPKSGQDIYIDVTIAPLEDSSGSLIGYKYSLLDVSKYINATKENKNLLEMFERCKDIIYKIDLVPEFKFVYISPSMKEVLGYAPEEHLSDSTSIFDLAHPEDYNILIKKIYNAVDYSAPIPTRFKHKDGHYVWLDDFCTPVYSPDGNLISLEGFSRDVTEKRELERKLEKLSFYDGLTGLYNKFYIEKEIDILNNELDTSIGVIFCDLDNLKVTNDNLGHEFGDKLITYTSNILIDIFSGNSIIARNGGDEFIIIIKNSTLNEVKKLYSMLCSTIEHQNKYNTELPISVSIGYSFSETSIGITRQVINIADKNMYKDKIKKKTLSPKH